MNADADLAALADLHGIIPVYRDLSGQERPTSNDTMKALLRANGLVLDNDAMIGAALKAQRAEIKARRVPDQVIVTASAPVEIDLPAGSTWQLDFDGASPGSLDGRGQDNTALPALAAGVHSLTVQYGTRTDQVTLIAAPPAAPSVADLTGQARLWGINAALYGLQSARNNGLGDYEDLARAAEAMAAQGAGFLGINPVHSLGWSDARTISPYSPSHRAFLNTAHIAVDAIPGLDGHPQAEKLLRRHSPPPPGVAELIDYDRHRLRQHALLEELFKIFQKDAGGAAQSRFDSFCADRGTALADFTLFEALSEDHDADWRLWPENLQAPDRPGAVVARRRLAPGMVFHAWLQWLADTQLSDAHSRAKRAGMALGLYLDLAVGARRGGAETWCGSDSIATGVSIGAPPDHLSPGGQNWDLAAYAPGKLAQTGYRAFRQVLRETMRHAGILRIDHVLGLNRSFWLPDDGAPGGYVRQPFDALLALVAIEATRGSTAVIGEDLGLVPDGFRAAITARGLYGYSVLQYEKTKTGFRDPGALRSQSLACFGTHDTPTAQGFRVGRDIDWWQKLGWIGKGRAKKARTQRRDEVQSLLALADEASDDLSNAVHTALAKSPVAMVSVQLDDLCGQSEAQNLPGTIDEHPNWRRRCPVPVEHFAKWANLGRTGRIMAGCGRGPVPDDHEEECR